MFNGKENIMRSHHLWTVLLVGLVLAVAPRMAWAHCDTLEGPVATDGKAALTKGDITPVLKWVKAEGEKEVREAFDKAAKVRALGADARELADKYFLETLVRVHRAGEGEPYTGLKSAYQIPEGIKLADAAISKGDLKALIKQVTTEVAGEIQSRYDAVAEKKRHAEHSVEAGRSYVAAYVSFIHYVEGLVAKSATHETLTPAAGHNH